MSIINEEKWKTFDNITDLIELEQRVEALNIENIKIKNPDNPAKLNRAKLITFYM